MLSYLPFKTRANCYSSTNICNLLKLIVVYPEACREPSRPICSIRR